METQTKTITVQAMVKAGIEDVWNFWTEPQHITRWNAASDDWHTTTATNDLREGGTFTARMEAKDGSMGFDFGGVYEKVKIHRLIEYKIFDGRQVKVTFTPEGNETKVVETFEPESINSIELQRGGWQAIMDNFKNYVESNT